MLPICEILALILETDNVFLLQVRVGCEDDD